MMDGVQYTSIPEMLEKFLTQYYLQTTWLPPEIHLPDVPEDAGNIEILFSERRNGKFSFFYPRRGEKLRLLNMTAMNAEMIIREMLVKRDRRKDKIPDTGMPPSPQDYRIIS